MACNSIYEILGMIRVYIVVIFLQFGFSGSYVIIAYCLKRGMNHFILSFYRLVIATIVVAPIALVLERKIRPKMTFSIFWKIVLLGFLEPVLDQNLYYMGLKYTSATFVSAMSNILPAITFIMAIIFRLENVNIKRSYDQAKIIGTVLSIGGGMVMTLYKGPIIAFFHGNTMAKHAAATAAANSSTHWILGTIFCLLSGCAWSAFFILQTYTVKEYSAKLSLTAWVCFMGSIEGGIVSLVMVRDFKDWDIGWDSRLVTVVYTGIVCTGIAYYLQTVVNNERGPMFLTAFSPLAIIFTTLISFFIFQELPHLGRIIGAIIIVIGLYAVIWGKSKDLAFAQENDEDVKLEVLPVVNSNIQMNTTKPDQSQGRNQESNIPRAKKKFIGNHT